MIALLAGLSIVGLGSQSATPPERTHSLSGTFRSIPAFPSKVLGNQRDLMVYLPPQYESEPRRRFSVLYLHDGQNVFDGFTSYLPNREWRADEAAEMLIRANLIEPIIMVAIPNMGAERADEFLPTRRKMGSNEMGGKADLYAQMLATEIKPHIDREFRTKPDRRNTAVGGSSFGGIVTLHIGLTHPQVFGKLLVVSPSVWWDDRVMLKRVKAFVGPKPKVWIDMGTQEGPGGVADGKALFEAFVAQGFKTPGDVTYVVQQGAAHNEDAWAARMPSMLTYLFGRR